MIIDFHTHTFPEKMAPAAIAKLSASANVINYVKGTVSDLHDSIKSAGIDYALIMPIVTNPKQEPTINRVAMETTALMGKEGILSFGSVHPDNENYKDIIKTLANNGIKGIKLHPVFQETYFDDIRYKRIIDFAMEQDLIVLTHAGFDISYPNQDYVTPSHIVPIIKELNPPKLVLAHMGGWDCWDEVISDIAGSNVYLDTSFTLSPLRSPKTRDSVSPEKEASAAEDSRRTKELQMDTKTFVEIVKKHGADRILFGSDSPWSNQAESISDIKKTGLTESEVTKILGDNAKALLKL